MKYTLLFTSAIVLFGLGIADYAYLGLKGFPSLTNSDAAVSNISANLPKDTVFSTDTLFKEEFSDNVFTSMYFPAGVTALSDNQEIALDSIVKSLDQSKKVKILLDGYASRIGKDSIKNNQIALSRAFSVYAGLLKCGISQELVYLRSFRVDSSVSLDDDSTRRVDITFSEE
jgi:outer membrane protein OmpA-like peptidoglycan-associated protein